LAQAAVVLARVHVGIAESIAVELAEAFSCDCSTAAVDSHTSVKADFMTFFSEGLVARAGVADSEADWHGEKRISLPIVIKITK
jgi:hypothetical protein